MSNNFTPSKPAPSSAGFDSPWGRSLGSRGLRSRNVAGEGSADVSDRVNRFLDHATFCGNQPDGIGGHVELWTLRKPLGKHPAGSTVTRSTIERLLFP